MGREGASPDKTKRSNIPQPEFVSATGVVCWLVLDQPHNPARRDGTADEQGKAECAEADHHPWLRSLRDAEDD